MSEEHVGEQVIVTKAEGVIDPPGSSITEKAVPPAPKPNETVVGAAVRVHLREILDAGRLTEASVERMLAVVRQSLALIQAVMGAGAVTFDWRAAVSQGVAVAGVPTILGIVPLDEWSSVYRGHDEDEQQSVAKVLVKIAAKRLMKRASSWLFGDAKDSVLDSTQARDLDASLRAKIEALLDRPYTPVTAKRLEALLDATSGLLRAIGPAQDRVSRPKKSAGMPPGVSWGSTLPVDGGPGTEGYEPDEEPEPLVTSPPAETFGAKIFREIMAMAPVLMSAQRNTPENMVLGIAAAEREGMPKLAVQLRKLMGVANPEEQETPAPALFSLRPSIAPEQAEKLWGGSPPPCGYCIAAPAGNAEDCGAPAKRAAKRRDGKVDPYCDKHFEEAVKFGEAVTDCVGAPSCAVEGTKPGVGQDGLTRLYCAFHHTEAVAAGEINHGPYEGGKCVDCGSSAGSPHGIGCSAVCP